MSWDQARIDEHREGDWYASGELPEVGDTVRHYVDGDEGEVIGYVTGTVEVNWRNDGVQQLNPDACFLIVREG